MTHALIAMDVTKKEKEKPHFRWGVALQRRTEPLEQDSCVSNPDSVTN